ncbi:Signal transduction histidine kinase [Malonomonas rubra DSM 5091]|uniref:histidine kinase n=1 Tax=Malonomonas rubra DSM 5091 TaxID=1122189 RepID=A0A1M6GMS2_MALRU|nr:ATP-binding protein [Malonomonas rubra]SHJ11219.1 Signal transduction histidine kinase [Malonomonas rubra DSM 5091]
MTEKLKVPLRSVQQRLFIPLAVGFIILLLSFSAALIYSQRSNLIRATGELLESSYDELFLLLDEQSDSLSALASLLLTDNELAPLLKYQQRDVLLNRYQQRFLELRDKNHVTHFYFHRSDQTNLLRIHKPGQADDFIDRITMKQAVETGCPSSGIELGPLGTFTLRAVTPVELDGEIVGYVELGREIEDAMSMIHRRYGTECIVAIDKLFLERETWEQGMRMLGREPEWDSFPQYVITYSSLEAGESFAHRLLSADLTSFTVDTGKHWHVLAKSLPDAAGAKVGKLILLHDMTEQQRFFVQLFIIEGCGTLILLLVFFAYLVYVRKNNQMLVDQQERLLSNNDQIQNYIDAIDKMGLGLRVIDENFKVQTANPTFRSWFADWSEKTCSKSVLNDDTPCPDCVRETGRSCHYQRETADGRVFDVAATPIHNPDGSISVMEVFNDITERRKSDQQQMRIEKLESIGVLAGGIAHDFNNLLAGIYGNIALAKRKLDAENPAGKYLTQAEKSLNRATNLTSKLLTFAKGGAPVVGHVSLGDLVREVVEFDLSGGNVKPVFQQADNIWVAEVDKGQVQQIFSNLTLNALQAMPNGGHLYVDLENCDGYKTADGATVAGKFIRVRFRDEGSGIPPEMLDDIFDPYFTTKQSGSGLGLATAYSIIKKHRGQIMVESEVGKGTIFTLYLPASPEVNMAGAMDVNDGRIGSELNARILVVDDEEIVRTLTAEILTGIGCRVTPVENGVLALEEYRRAKDSGSAYELVILDLTIPGGMGGKEVARHLLEIDPEVQMIVSSGYADDAIMANYADYGFKDVVSKPFTVEKLTAVVEQVLSS